MATLNDREKTLHQKLRQWSNKQPFPGLRLKDPRVSRVRAIRALAVLGPVACAAIPALAAQLGDPVRGTHAVYALQATGRNGLRAMVNQLTNRSSLIQMEIGTAMMTSSSATDDAGRAARCSGSP